MIHAARSMEELKSALGKGLPFAVTACGRALTRKEISPAIEAVNCPICVELVSSQRKPVKVAFPEIAPSAPPVVENKAPIEVDVAEATGVESDLDIPDLDVEDGKEADPSVEVKSEEAAALEPKSEAAPENGHAEGGMMALVEQALAGIVPADTVIDPEWEAKLASSTMLSDEDKAVFMSMVELGKLAAMFKQEKLGEALMKITGRFAEIALKRDVPAPVPSEVEPAAEAPEAPRMEEASEASTPEPESKGNVDDVEEESVA